MLKRALGSCFFWLLLFLGMGLENAAAQYGKAPPGYYPNGYFGATFEGNVTQNVNGILQMEHVGKKKTESFQGNLKAPCVATGNETRIFQVSDIPIGWHVLVLYNPRTIKDNGKKVEMDEIIGFVPLQVEGEKLDPEKLPIIWCTTDKAFKFRYW